MLFRSIDGCFFVKCGSYGNTQDITSITSYLRSESEYFVKNNSKLCHNTYPELELKMKGGRSVQSSKQLKVRVSHEHDYEK